MECMGSLELFLHDDRPDIPLVIKAGLYMPSLRLFTLS